MWLFLTKQVEVTDRGNPEKISSSLVKVNIKRDLFLPEFSGNFNRDIDVNYPVNGEAIVRVQATDEDKVGQLVYKLVGIYPAQHFFRIDNSTGEIFVKESLKNDNRRLTSYTLSIQAYDTAYPDATVTTSVEIRVNRNANAPQFVEDSYDEIISENFPLVTEVVRVEAKDLDGDNITYVLVADSSVTAMQYFFIEDESGIIMLRKPLTDGGMETFTFRVRAYDEGIPKRFAEVEVFVNVRRNQFPPQFIGAPYQVKVSENKDSNSGLATVRAEDKDLQGQMVYELIGIKPADRYFRVTPNQGFIFVKEDLKTDRALEYTLIIQAYDSKNPGQKATAEMIITVSRNENGPIFQRNAYSKKIQATTSLGSNIVTVIANDSDVKDVLKYSIIEDDRCKEYLYLNADTGVVYLKKLVQDNSLIVFACTIEVTDQGYPEPNTASVRLTIDIERNVELPKFTQTKYNVPVAESEEVNTVLITVEAQLSLVVGTIFYEVTGEYPAPDFFEIDQTGGQVRITRDLSLDSLQLNSYTLMLKAYDSATPDITGEAVVYIEVKRNVNKPRFPSPSLNLQINSTMMQGTVIGQVTASDDDDKDKLYYSLTGDDTAMVYFFVDTESGEISLKKSIALDTNDKYQVGQTCRRCGQLVH